MPLIEFDAHERQKLAGLFTGHLGGFMPNSILDGSMGRAFADQEYAQFAILQLPNAKVSILGGDYTHPLAHQYLKTLPRFTQLFTTSPDFAVLANQVHPKEWIELKRFAFSTEQLDIAKLHGFKTHIAAGFHVVKIDIALAKQFAEHKNRFAAAHGMNFDSPEDFVARGFGYCALDGSNPVCVASSFVVCQKGVEIQIDTKKNYQGQGLGTAVAATMIIHCLENNIVPGWDAATQISVRLAEKLGFTPQGEYTMLVFTGSRLLVALRNSIHKVRRMLKK